MSDGVRYRTIVCDPPWRYDEGHIKVTPTGYSQNVARDGARAVQGRHVRRALPYPSLSVAEIAALPVRDLAEDDARLFLWTTNRYLPDAFGVLMAWGFTYRQMLVWHKADGGPFVASVAPNTAEFLLVATIGKPERTGSIPSSVIRDGSPKEHSRKPECFLDHIEGCSPAPRLEMFARRQRLGWDTHGNEALNHVRMETA